MFARTIARLKAGIVSWGSKKKRQGPEPKKKGGEQSIPPAPSIPPDDVGEKKLPRWKYGESSVFAYARTKSEARAKFKTIVDGGRIPAGTVISRVK